MKETRKRSAVRPWRRGLAGLVCAVMLAVGLFPVTASADTDNLPNGWWPYWEDYADAVASGNKDQILKTGDALVDFYSDYPMSVEIADHLCRVYFERLESEYFEEAGDYDAAIDNTLKLREVCQYLTDNGSDYKDIVIRCDAHLDVMEPMSEVYAVSYTQQSPYDSDAVAASGSYYGSIFQGDLVTSGNYSVAAVYVELETETAEKFDYIIDPLDTGDGIIQINLNFLYQGDTARKVPTGAYDDSLRTTLNYLNGLRTPVIMRVGAEMDIWETWTVTPEEYIAAFRYIADMTRQLAPNVELVWSPNYTCRWNETIDMYYPGDQYVDWVGLSLYFNYDSTTSTAWDWLEYSHLQRFADPVENARRVVEFAKEHGKPVAATEGGAIKNGPQGERYAARQAAKMYSTLTMVFPEVKSIVYFDRLQDGNDYRMAGSVLSAVESAVSGNPSLIKPGQDTAGTYIPLSQFNEQTDGQMVLGAYARTYYNFNVNASYYLDGVNVANPTSAPNQYVLNTAALSTGSHTLRVDFNDGHGWTDSREYRLVKAADGTVTVREGAQAFSDTVSHWGRSFITTASDAGLMAGVGDGKFDPDGSLNVSQVLVLAANAHAKAAGATVPAGSGGYWYQGFYDYCADNGIIDAGQLPAAQCERPATRMEMISILDRALPDSQLSPRVDIPEGYIPDVSADDPDHDLVYRWYRAGIIAGGSDHSFNGDTGITRAEVAVILCQLNGLA